MLEKIATGEQRQATRTAVPATRLLSAVNYSLPARCSLVAVR
jgi:hypothetical protein